MNNQRPDIAGRPDIEILVNSFYEKVGRDELLAPIFLGAPGFDWEHHLPTMYLFWETLLFRTNTYTGQPWPKHAVLKVKGEHFERWLSLFIGTIHEHFSGPMAMAAEGYALNIADAFQRRLGIR